MVKSILFCCLFAILMQTGFSQHYTGEVQSLPIIKEKLKVKSAGYKSIGVLAGKGYFLYLPHHAVYTTKCIGCNRNYYIACYDSEMKLQNKGIVDLLWRNNAMKFEKVQIIGEKLFLFSSYQNTKKNKHYLFVREIDPVSLSAEGDPKMIAELDYSSYSRYRETSLVTGVSEDQSKIMIFYSFLSKDDLVLKNGIKVFDENFNEIWQIQDFQPDKSEGNLHINLFEIDNHGNVYFGGIIYGVKTYRKWDFKTQAPSSLSVKSWLYFERPNYKYHLYAFAQNGQKTLYKEISLSKKFIRALKFKPESPEKLTCYGLWCDEGMVSPKGSFMFQLNIAEGLVLTPVFNEFSTKSESNIFTEKELKNFQSSIDNNKEWDPFNYWLSDLMVKPDGETFFIAEQRTDGMVQSGIGERAVFKRSYYYGDLFVNFAGTSESEIKTIRVPKTQYLIGTSQPVGYFVTQKGDHLIFVYLNMPRKGDYSRRTILGDQLMVDMNPEGNMSTTILHENIRLFDFLMLPGTTLSVSENVIGYVRANFKNVSSFLFEKLTIMKE